MNWCKGETTNRKRRNIYIVNAVDEWIVAAVAHGQPVGTEPQDVYVFILVDIVPGDVQHVVQLQWKPAYSEQ